MTRWPYLCRRSFFGLGAGALLATPSGAATEAPDATSDRDRRIWTSAFSGQRIWGYVDKHGILPGEPFNVMLSTGPAVPTMRGRLVFFRISHRGNGFLPVWTSQPIEISHQPVSRTAASVGANWPPTLEIIDTAGWSPGYYSADFVEDATRISDIQVAQIIVINPARSGTVLLRLSTNTYQAYNSWGGHSLYPSDDEEKRGAMVSFDRPTPPSFFEYEVYLARWLEALGAQIGFGVDYAANFDVHRHPEMIERYRLVISGSHDEYWSKEEFDSFEHRIFKRGGNTIFFGANAAYFQVRYADLNRPPDGTDLGRQMVCYKSLTDPIAQRQTALDPALLVTARFREDARRPEAMLMGVAYQSWFRAIEELRYPYYVVRADLPLFDGTGWNEGDVAADVVGYEWDNRDPKGDGARLWDAEQSRIAELPLDKVVVLFRGHPTDEDGKPGMAEAVYFESAAHAKVFSAGSVRWAWGLGKPGFASDSFKRFNENLIRDFLS